MDGVFRALLADPDDADRLVNFLNAGPQRASPVGLTTSGGMWVESNDALLTLTGLGSLTAVGGYGLNVLTNPSLTSLEGLEALTMVSGSVSIVGNASLTSLDALAGLETIGGDLSIRGNALLSQSEAEAFAARVAVSRTNHVDDNGP